MENIKLSVEDKELLLETRNSSEVKGIIKLLKILVIDQERMVLQTDLRTSTDRDLCLAKARTEGARKLIRDVEAYLQRSPKTDSKT